MWLYFFHFFILLGGALLFVIVDTIFCYHSQMLQVCLSQQFLLDSGILRQQNALAWYVIWLSKSLEVVSASCLWVLFNQLFFMLFIFIFFILLLTLYPNGCSALNRVKNQTWSNWDRHVKLHFIWYWYTFLYCTSAFCIYWISATHQSFWEVFLLTHSNL